MKILNTKYKTPLPSAKIFIVIVMIIFVVIMIMLSPIFKINTIDFQGGEKYTQEDILSRLGMKIGDNILRINAKQLEELLIKDPYVNSVDINMKYPNKINITVKERKVRGYVPYMGAYLYIDEEGRVLEVATAYKQKLPIVEGLRFDEFQTGEVLKVKNEDAFDVVLNTANMMLKYDFIDDVIKIDANDPENIHIYIRFIDVMLGDLNNYDEKIRTMLEIIKKIPEQDRGFLDIKDLTKPIIFEYLT